MDNKKKRTELYPIQPTETIMSKSILHAISIPVLMLMIRDLEFHREELVRDHSETDEIDQNLADLNEVLSEKTAD